MLKKTKNPTLAFYLKISPLMKFTFEEAFSKIIQLSETFEKNINYYKSSRYQEAEVRKDFIDPFFTLLGWDVNHVYETNPYKQEVKVEKTQSQIGEAGKKFADYAFYLAPDFKNPIFYVEAKKPAVLLRDNAQYYLQTHKYGWNSQTPLAVLTDFEELIVIDCRAKPNPQFSVNTGIKKFSYHDYSDIDKFREIYYLFSREAVAEGSIPNFVQTQIPQIAGKSRQTKMFGGGYKPVDEDFLEFIDDLRLEFARGFIKQNPELSSEELTEATQKVIDRLVFIRFLEDKQIEFDEHIYFIQRWKDFIVLCKKLDLKYNGVVFKRSIIDEESFLGLPDHEFRDICMDISSKESPYNFNVIPVHILGNIYERFLGKIVCVEEGKVTIELKPEVRKAGGVFYTPKYIVDYLVQKTVGKIVTGKTPKEIDNLSFGDISCGSGSFLIGVYEYLIDYHQTYYQEKLKGKTSLDKRSEDFGNAIFLEGAWTITIKRKQEILLSSMYGVDIDSQAVEVTQLSLFLKLLENENLTSTAKQTTMFSKVLPDLSHNIFCGNSLVGWDINNKINLTPSQERAINPFNFQTAFPKVFRRGGFDALVGNPPYVKEPTDKETFDLVKLSYLHRYYQGKMDLWYFFVCSGIDMLRDGGFLGYIIPNNWTTNAGASIMRNKIIIETEIKEMIDFGNYMVFKDASIQTMNLLIKKNKSKQSYKLLYSRLKSNSDIGEEQAISLLNQEANPRNYILHPKIKRNDYIDQYILIADKASKAVLTLIEKKGNFLLNNNEIAQGIAPNPDQVNKRNIEKLSDEWVRERDIKVGDGVFVLDKNFFGNLPMEENRFIKPLYEPYLTEQYYLGAHDKEIIYSTSKASINEEMPTLMEHLSRFRPIMESRRENQKGAREFYHLHWDRDVTFFEPGPKILSVRKCDYPTFIYTEREAYVMLSFNVIKSRRINLKYLTGILNSSLIKFWLLKKGKMQGDSYQVDSDPLKAIPIYRTTKRDLKAQMIMLVDSIMECKRMENEVRTMNDREFYKRKAENLEFQINQLVYELYDISPEEKELIETEIL